MTRNFIVILFILTSCSHIKYIDGSKKVVSKSIYLAQGDSIINANVWIGKSLKKVDLNAYYYWYFSDNINYSQGNYTGALMHNEYIVQNLNDKKLLTKGYFDKGLKSGTWIIWYENGKIKEVSEWNKGLKNGNYKLYNNDGILLISQKYKNGIEIVEKQKVDTKHLDSTKQKSDTTWIKKQKNKNREWKLV